MQIFYVSVIEHNAGWGAETFINNALQHNGHTTYTLDYRQNRYQLHRAFMNQPGDFDAFFLQRGDYFPLKLVECIQRPRVFYFSELVATRRDADHLFKANVFDHYFVRSDHCQTLLQERSWVPAHKVSVLLSAVDPATYNYSNTRPDIDVLFIGNLSPRRKALLHKIRQHHPVTVKSAYGSEAGHFYNRAKIILNLHAHEALDTETRVFEVLGAGGFLLTEKLSSESPFQTGVHLVEVQSTDEIIESIAYYLHHQADRTRIAKAGYDYVQAHHTYAARTQEIIDKLEMLVAQTAFPKTTPAIRYACLQRYAPYEYLARFKHQLRSHFSILKKQFKKVKTQ